MGLTQTPLYWMPKDVSAGVKRLRRKLTTALDVVQKKRLRRKLTTALDVVPKKRLRRKLTTALDVVPKKRLRRKLTTALDVVPKKRPRRKLTTALDVVPKIRIRGAVSPFPRAPIWCGAWLSTGTTYPFLLPLVWCNFVFRNFRPLKDCCISYCSQMS